MPQHEQTKQQTIEDQYKKIQQTKAARIARIGSGIAWNLILLFFIALTALAIFGASVGAGYFAYLVSKEPLRPYEEMRNAVFNYEETSEIYYANNIYFGKINADIEREETSLDHVSQHVIDAVLATEDEYFFEHNGIVPKAILRGLLQDVSNASSQTGGSTLTQQLVKNQILTNEVSYERKAKEILLAMRLEKAMNKKEILEAYLNVIPYGRNVIGQNIAGVQTAAQGIFALNADELNLPQAAFIAGIPQAPFAHTPFKSASSGGGVKEPKQLERGIARMKTVLFRMKETGYISEEEYKKAIAYDITQDFREPYVRANVEEPYLAQEIQNRTVDILKKVLAKKDGIDLDALELEAKEIFDHDKSKMKEFEEQSEKYAILARRDMQTGGYQIYSTIDKDIFKKMNEEAQNFKQYGFTYSRKVKNKETGEIETVPDPVQVGAVMMDNRTGKIISFVGGRDFELIETNHATQAYRQNGSSIKPLLVYAPAIEFGRIGAGSPLVDVKFTLNDHGSSYTPSNYEATKEYGIVPARDALAKSLNISTMRLYMDIMPKHPFQFLEKMNLSKVSPAEEQNPTASFGALTHGVTVEENTKAFATLANQGVFNESYMIEKITDKQGNVIYEHELAPTPVYSPETAYIVTDMLKGVTKSGGTAGQLPSYLNFKIDLAAKTGTTNDYGDSWLMGYNPNITLGVWLGYKDRILADGTKRRLKNKNESLHPTTRASMLFGKLMNAANSANPELIGAQSKFERPANVVSRSFCGISGLAPSKTCSNAGLVVSDLFNAKVMVPSGTDDSIISSSYVSVKGTPYLALPSTPAEFIKSGGTGVNAQFIQRIMSPLGGDASKLFPSGSLFSGNIVAGNVFSPDDVAPAAVSPQLSGTTISWQASSSNDVIGYYVLKDGVRIATIHDGQALSIAANSPGRYTIIAVDITGLQTSSSELIIEAEEPKLPEEEEKEEKEPEENETPEVPDEAVKPPSAPEDQDKQ